MPPRSLVTALRVLLGVAFAVLIFAQLRAVPAMYDDWVRDAPEPAAARWPMLVVALLALLCVEVMIVSIWRLLALVTDDRIFSEQSFGWVNAILAAIGVAGVLLLGALAYGAGPLGLPAGPSVALLLVLVATAVVGLLMVVMRALLRQAAALRSDLEEVI
jgi:hypothetical protein